jgi:hypothetical protein
MKRFFVEKHYFYMLVLSATSLFLANPAVAVTPQEVAKLVGSDVNNNHEFGYSVGLSGDTAVIGSPRHTDTGTGLRSGGAFVFVRNTASVPCPVTATIDPWCEQAELLASDAANNDRFGFWVAIDGDTAVVGSRQDGDAGFRSGSAYVFTRTGTVWSQQAKLTASDAATLDRFGTSVSISGDTAIIGAGEADGVGENSGKAYVYTRTGVVWNEEAILTAADAAAGNLFGHKVSVYGETALLGSYLDDAPGVDSGSAYIFERNTAAVVCPETLTVDPWCQQAKLTASDGNAGHWFGAGVSLSSDTALVGAPHADGLNPDSGAAYVFKRSGNTWSEQTKLTAADGETGDAFGFALDIFGDAAVIPADGDDDLGSNSGSAYVFVRSGNSWNQSPKFYASDGMEGELFGWSISISGDTAVLGAPRPFFPPVPGSGSAYIFDLNSDETPIGNDVVVAPSPVDENGDPVEDAPEISLAFDTVSGEGETTVTITEDGPPPPGGFGVIGEAGSTYIELETTATFEGLVEVCIDYSLFELTVPPASLAFAHFVDGVWVDITSSNDLVNMILCGLTPSFSFFAIFAVEDPLAVLDGLDAAVAALDAKKGTIKSLQSKLKTVRKKLTDGKPKNDGAAANILMNSFVNKVEARRGKDISDADADALISSAVTLATFVHP